MATLKVRYKKDDPPFFNVSNAQHDGNSSMSNEELKNGAVAAVIALDEVADKLKKMGYDPQTIRFSIKTKS